MKQTMWFVIVTYKPERETLRRLKSALEDWPVVLVDNTEKNLGFGGGANKGMSQAFEEGARWVVVCNQDVELTRAGISHFCAIAKHCDSGIVGPEAGSLDPRRWTTILPNNKNIDYISGSLMAIHRDVYMRMGGFYEPYFMYYEDADLCVRAKKAGFALTPVTIEGFRHESSGSNASNASKEYYLARNHLLFVLRNAPMFVKLYELLRLPKTALELWL